MTILIMLLAALTAGSTTVPPALWGVPVDGTDEVYTEYGTAPAPAASMSGTFIPDADIFAGPVLVEDTCATFGVMRWVDCLIDDTTCEIQFYEDIGVAGKARLRTFTRWNCDGSLITVHTSTQPPNSVWGFLVVNFDTETSAIVNWP